MARNAKRVTMAEFGQLDQILADWRNKNVPQFVTKGEAFNLTEGKVGTKGPQQYEAMQKIDVAYKYVKALSKQTKSDDCVNCGNYLTVMEQTLAANTKKMLCEFCIGAK
jgi:hypothetical protein